MCKDNGEVTLLASAARTATTTSDDQTNLTGKAAQVVLNVSSITASPSITLTIQGKDSISGNYYTIITGAAVVGTGTTTYTAGLGVASVANVAIGTVLPKTWRVSIAHGDTDSITYSVSATVVG